jgi:hypothetical protein
MVGRGDAVETVALRPFPTDAVLLIGRMVVLFGLVPVMFAPRALGIVGSET